MGIVRIVMLAKNLQCAKTPDDPQDGDEHRTFNGRHRHGDSRDVMLAKDLQCVQRQLTIP